MTIPGLDAEDAACRLGIDGVDNIVTNAERICGYEQERIKLSNESTILGLQAQFHLLADEERHIEERLQIAPPPGDLRRLRRRAIYYWSLTAILTLAGFAFTLLTFSPFRLGWKSWIYCGGIAAITPFLVEKLLEDKKMERTVKVLTAFAMVAALASLMLLAVIRGNLLVQEIHQDAAPAVVIDDAQPQPELANNFYDSTSMILRVSMLLMAFAMEMGAGLALREAWRTRPDASEDWSRLREKLAEVRHQMAEIVRQATWLRNEPAIFAAHFWRDFYRSLLSNAARSAMSKLLVLIAIVGLFGISYARAQDHLTIGIAIDLTQSVAISGPDGKHEFQKNIDGVTRLLSQIPAGSFVTVFGITDHSFAQPYILLTAHIPEDPGYFGERLSSARRQLVNTWKLRSTHLDPHFPRTDILGALQLASQIFAQHPDAGRRTLVIFSDMRHNTSEVNMEAPQVVPSFSVLGKRCGALPVLHNVQVYVLGADGAGKTSIYWQSLQEFWRGYFQHAGANLQAYSVLRELPEVGSLWSWLPHP